MWCINTDCRSYRAAGVTDCSSAAQQVKCFDSDVSPQINGGPAGPAANRHIHGVHTSLLSPVLVLVSPGAGPVELERGGTLVLVLLLGFFSMTESVQWVLVLRPSSGQRAAELSSIKQRNAGEGGAVSAGQAAKALIHFCQTRGPHHGDILTITNRRKKKRHDFDVSSYGGW